VIVGLTRYATKAHLCRAVLEASAFQTSDVLASMVSDSGIQINSLRVDGGVTKSDMLMQFQSDVIGIEVVRPEMVRLIQ
jgi:glycerol kinase